MTDASIAAAAAAPVLRQRTPEAVATHIRARYRAERRFKAYGLGALLISALFVVVLLGDILIKGVPAFWQNSVALDVTFNAETIDPAGTRKPEDLRGADYFPLARDAIMAAIPGVTGRGPERTLSRLLSTGATDAIREAVVADPSIIGTTRRLSVLLSDDADLYLKSDRKQVSTRPGAGTATLALDGSDAVIDTANDAFAPALAEFKQALAARAVALRTEIARLNRGGAETVRERIAELTTEAAALEARAAAKDAPEDLDSNTPSVLVEIGGGLVKLAKLAPRRAEGSVMLPVRTSGEAAAGTWSLVRYAVPESARKATDQEIAFIEQLHKSGRIENNFNWRFFTAGDSREPELAGIRGALIGSLLTLAVTLFLCVPIGVMAAVYLEEFAPKNRLTTIIEVNINNLAAVPSIVFGLLGLAVFLNFIGLPRSAPLVGGLVLALLVLPTIIIASRAALKAVPPSIKEAALGVGASHQQAVFHHVLPLAMPGIMTGTIIGMAHALGETAPLLMIGMVAFIVDIPGGITSAATVMPVQIYLWSDLPEQAFKAKTAAAIVVLLGFLFVMNGMAIWLRKRFERRW
jgi:phosphate transport system permease protein